MVSCSIHDSLLCPNTFRSIALYKRSSLYWFHCLDHHRLSSGHTLCHTYHWVLSSPTHDIMQIWLRYYRDDFHMLSENHYSPCNFVTCFLLLTVADRSLLFYLVVTSYHQPNSRMPLDCWILLEYLMPLRKSIDHTALSFTDPLIHYMLLWFLWIWCLFR